MGNPKHKATFILTDLDKANLSLSQGHLVLA